MIMMNLNMTLNDFYQSLELNKTNIFYKYCNIIVIAICN